jgi:hypothetical protein
MGERASVATQLRRLECLRDEFGPEAAAKKRRLIASIARRRLRSAGQVLRFHEVLCFWRAYPDDPATLAAVERVLRRFPRRADLRRHAEELAGSGIGGTAIRFSFFHVMADWLAERWPDRLRVDWESCESGERLSMLLYLLLTPSEIPMLDALTLQAREWIERVKPAHSSDAAFVLRRFARLPLSRLGRELLYDDLELPLLLSPGPDTPSRSLSRRHGSRVAYRPGPLRRERPDLAVESGRPPRRLRDVSTRQARELLDLAREAMVTRARDLDAFANADLRDVRVADLGGGLEVACFGVRPERRFLLESLYGFLMIRSGVPIGYTQSTALLGSVEVAFNVFETFRGAETAWILARTLALFRTLFAADVFAVEPYQLGHENDEGLASGAFWFYYKLGFRPVEPAVRRLVASELDRMRRDPSHRSGEAVLRRLVTGWLVLQLGRPRRDVLGRFSSGRVGERIARMLSRRFGADRERGLEQCATEARRRLGAGGLRGWSDDEREAWRRWGPLLAVVPGIAEWTRGERRGVVSIVRAKGGRRESDYVVAFDRHERLRRAVAALGS